MPVKSVWCGALALLHCLLLVCSTAFSMSNCHHVGIGRDLGQSWLPQFTLQQCMAESPDQLPQPLSVARPVVFSYRSELSNDVVWLVMCLLGLTVCSSLACHQDGSVISHVCLLSATQCDHVCYVGLAHVICVCRCQRFISMPSSSPYCLTYVLAV